MGRRIRKHANPFTVPTEVGPLDQEKQFGQRAPIEVDVGCGAGDFLMQRATAHPGRNFVGFEIRKPLVEASNRRATQLGLQNLVYFWANAHGNLDFVEQGLIDRFCIQFPDPCFKKRHWKRRILQPNFVRAMAERLDMGGEIFVQSDVQPLAEEMYSFLSFERALESMGPPDLRMENPFQERSEWERQHEREREPIYRMLFRKMNEPSGPVPKPDFRNTKPSADQTELSAVPPQSGVTSPGFTRPVVRAQVSSTRVGAPFST